MNGRQETTTRRDATDPLELVQRIGAVPRIRAA